MRLPIVVAAGLIMVGVATASGEPVELDFDCKSFGRTYWEAYCLCTAETAFADYVSRAEAGSASDVGNDDIDAIATASSADCEVQFTEGLALATEDKGEERAQRMSDTQRSMIDTRVWLFIEQQRANALAAED